MIIGAHSTFYSTNSDADRAFFQNVLKLPSVDVGGGWLIFGLPPAEIAVHPSDKNGVHELYLMCKDVEVFMAEMERRGITCDPVVEQDWGLVTQVTLPGGSKLGVYEPRHARPETPSAGKPTTTKKPAKRVAKTATKVRAKKPAKRAASKPAKKAAKKATKKAAKRKPKKR